LVSLAEGIKKVVAVPVITVGRINDPSLAERILQEGKADLIALGRPLIADPDFPQKALEKREKEIRKCIACNVCIDSRIRLKADLRCTINPEFGKDEEYQYKPARSRKKVLVIGGGPGGMEAARVARIRGHQVTLWEESAQLGGQLVLAAKAPSKKEIWNIIDYYEYMLKKLGVDVELQKKATLETVEEMKPGVIIAATGAYALRPNIPGSDGSNVVTAHDVLGERVKLKGKNIVIIGGGAVGCETAEYLAEKGFILTVVEMLDDVAMDVEKITRKTVLDIIAEKNIKILTHAGVTRIEKGKVVFIDGGGKERSISADTVILAMGSRPDDELIKSLKERRLPVFAVGDCVEPRKAIDAIQEGFSIACGI
jgi:NADPH-dependent 2,4-dienoyl-CoA reductase/sulfur reductase-like enzyme